MKQVANKIFRWKGFFWLGAIFFVLAAYYFLLFDFLVKTSLEKYASRINGAEVNIDHLRIRTFSQIIEVEGIKVTHHVQPQRNIVEIQNLQFGIKLQPLLRKKIIIHSFSLDGIKINSKRNTPGLIKVAEDYYGVPSIVDRVVSSLYLEVRNRFKNNPLKHLGQLLTGMDLSHNIMGILNRLKTPNSLREQKETIDKQISQWEEDKNLLYTQGPANQIRKHIDTQLEALKSNPEDDSILKGISALQIELRSKLNRIESLHHNFDVNMKAFYEKVEQTRNDLDSDVELVKDQLRLPNFDGNDLSHQLFGPETLNYLERLSYWINQLRRRMPKDSHLSNLPVMVRSDQHGAVIHFGGKNNPYPAFLISQIALHSELDAENQLGEVKGTINNLTSDPPILGFPLEANLSANFPENGLKDIQLKLHANHTGGAFKDQLQIRVGTLPVKDLKLHQASDLEIAINNATASLAFEGSFDDEGMDAHWTMDFDNVDYEISSRYRKIEKSIKSILTPIISFQVKGFVKGPFESLELETTSSLGQRLLASLRDIFKHELAAIDSTIKSNLVDYVEIEHRNLISKAQSIYDKGVRSLNSLREEIQQSLNLVNSSLPVKPSRGISESN